jgi:thiamine biosynthesis protein ThiC
MTKQQQEQLIVDTFNEQSMKPMNIGSTFELNSNNNTGTSATIFQQLRIGTITSPMKDMDDVQVLMALSLYITIFTILTFVWAYHRSK